MCALPEESKLPVSGASDSSAPALAKGADDIYWVHKLHEALTVHGYYPDDDEAADWFFGDHTASAVIAFQACMLRLMLQPAMLLAIIPSDTGAVNWCCQSAASSRVVCCRPAGACPRQACATF